MTTSSSSIFARGYEALEAEDLDGVRSAMDQALAAGVADDDARLGYLRFMSAWLDEASSQDELEQLFADAAEVIEGALKLTDGAEAARIALDLADLLAQAGEFDDAEHALRALCEREDVAAESRGNAAMLRASILLDHHEDPEEALAILDAAPASLRSEPGYLSLRAATLLDLDRGEEAITSLEAALKTNDDVELRYQLGVALRETGREEDALVQLFAVRKHDLANYEIDADQPVDDDEVEDLRRRVEDVLDTLPDPVIARVASATIRIERWASEAAIRAGTDPRTPVSFEGKLADEAGGEEGSVDALIVYRDAIVAQIDDDEEILDVIAMGLVEEFDRFFDLELIPGM
jgi:thioredoxin-like negative regulator of GroEL/predicted Zn-dependent protease with MMP-like domain